MHNPITTETGRKEAAEILTWGVGGDVVSENDEYFLLSTEEVSDETREHKEMTTKISELLGLEVNNIWRLTWRFVTC